MNDDSEPAQPISTIKSTEQTPTVHNTHHADRNIQKVMVEQTFGPEEEMDKVDLNMTAKTLIQNQYQNENMKTSMSNMEFKIKNEESFRNTFVSNNSNQLEQALEFMNSNYFQDILVKAETSLLETDQIINNVETHRKEVIIRKQNKEENGEIENR